MTVDGLPGVLRIDHVGVAVPDLDEAIAFYTRVFGMTCVHTEVNEEQGVREAMLAVGPTGNSADSGEKSPSSGTSADSGEKSPSSGSSADSGEKSPSSVPGGCLQLLAPLT